MLDKKNNNRSYLFGRVYAVLHFIQANSKSFSNDSPTFVETNWRNIYQFPKKYLLRADETANLYKTGLDLNAQELCANELMDVYDLFDEVDFMSDKRVDEKFLLGYNVEMEHLWSELRKEK